jgi:ribonuclease HII
MFRPSTKPASGGPERVRWRHAGHTPRRNAGLAAYENVLARAGFSPVAGIDEAGRGACAGPLVVAAVVLDSATIRRLPGLADSKALSPDEREDVYAEIMRRALDWHVLAIPPQEVDALGLHVCNVEGMRRALAGLRHRPGYVLTDGFPVRGLGAPALAVWKGDQVTASVAAASVVAKVTRDRMMVALGECYPAYGFARHKGYSTPEHMTALCAYGPCPEHRYSYANVIEANRRWATGWQDGAALAGATLAGAADLEDGAAQDGAAEGRPVPRLEDFGPPAPDGREPGDAWADFIAEGVTVSEVDETDAAWANTSQATRLGTPPARRRGEWDPWLSSGDGVPPDWLDAQAGRPDVRACLLDMHAGHLGVTGPRDGASG